MDYTTLYILIFIKTCILLLIGIGIPFLGYLMKSKIAIWILSIIAFFIGLFIFSMTHNSACEGGAILGLIWALRKHSKRLVAASNKEEKK